MGGDDRARDWRRLEDLLQARALEPGGESLSYNTLMGLCGRAEVDGTMAHSNGTGMDGAAAYSNGILMRFGQHRAAGLRTLYDERHGVPPVDATGQRQYKTRDLIVLVQELQALAG